VIDNSPGGEIGNVNEIGGGTTDDSEKRALNILNEDSEPEVEESEESEAEVEETSDEIEETEESSDEEVSESEEETETPEEEELPDVKPDELTVSGKAAYDTLKGKYPQVLKDIPELRQVFFREKAFSDIYATVEEARGASADSEFLNGLGSALEAGEVKNVFTSLSEKSLGNLAEKFIPALMETNKDLFVRATKPFIANILNDAYEHGQHTANKDLMKSVLWVSKFLTGKPELPKRFSPQVEDPKLKSDRETFENEKRTFFNNQANGFVTAADNAVFNGLNKTLQVGLDNDGQLSTFVKNAIIKETIEELKTVTNKDQQFTSMMSELFRRSQRAGFDQESKSRLVSAYLGRVKDIALKIRARKKTEALGQQRRERIERPVQEESKTPQPRRIAPIPNTKKQMSELDIIRSR